MTRHKKPSKKPVSIESRATEWVGARLSPPFFVQDPKNPYRVTMAIWMELPSGLVVGQDVFEPKDDAGSVGRVLEQALQQPLAGPPRRPHRLRVPDEATAAEVRAVTGDQIPLVIAPTPELDELLDLMLKEMPGSPDDVSYLQGGHIPSASVQRLFESAQLLYRIAPWKIATDDQVLRLDIPGLRVKGACLSIIGHLGENLGLLVFPSLNGYNAFLRSAKKPRTRRKLDAGTTWLALSFERGAELSPTQRREIDAHRWPVADAHGYPVVTHHDRDGHVRPLIERDVDIAAATATALAVFFGRHQSLFEAELFHPVRETFVDPRGLEVMLTAPYEGFE